jgi:hypothetical protein
MNRMAKCILPIAICSACIAMPAQAGFNLDVLKQLGIGDSAATAPDKSPTATSTAGLSQAEMSGGLKEALDKGVKHAISQLGRNGGFLNDSSVKIPLPESLAKIESVLRSLHQERLADEFVASMNHAAEKAVPEAADVFSNAVRAMTMQDVQGILSGPDNAATQYFRKTSEAELRERFRPIVESATTKAGVTAAYKNMMNKAGPLAQFMGGAEDLDGYVTNKALDGLFLKIAEEEKAIRTNPVARTTDLLKKIFGSQGR